MRVRILLALSAALLSSAVADESRERVREQALRVEIERTARKAEGLAASGSFSEALEALRRAELALLGLGERTEETRLLGARLRTLRLDWTPKAEEEVGALREARTRSIETHLSRELAQEAARREAARRILLERFEGALAADRWTEAERWLRILREGAPRDPLLEALGLRLDEARHGRVREGLRSSLEDEWRNLRESASEQQVPYSREVLRFPEGFLRATREREEQLGEALAREEAWRTELREKLRRRVRFHFDKTPFPEALSVLENAGSLVVNVDTAAREKVPDLDALPVTFSTPEEGMALDTALTWILKGTGLSWGMGDESLRISTPEGVQEAPVFRRHDVRDVLTVPLDFPGPTLTLQTGGKGVELQEQKDEDLQFTGENLTDFIKTQVMPFVWNDPRNSISCRQGTLFVNAPPSAQKAVGEVLRGFREQRTLQVLIQTRFLDIEDTALEDISVEWKGLNGAGALDDVTSLPAGTTPGFRNPLGLRTDVKGAIASRGTLLGDANVFPRAFGGAAAGTTDAGGLGMQIALLDNFQIQAVLGAVEKSRKAAVLTAPSILCFNTQRANILNVVQLAYIQDVTAVVQVGVAIFDPDIGYVQTGSSLDVRPVVSADRRYVTLELRPTVSRLQQFRPFTIVGGGGFATIEGPVVELRSARATVSVPDGGTLLVGGLTEHDTLFSYGSVPFLSKIPFLKALVSDQLRTHNRKNQVILLKVQVVDPRAEEERRLGK